MTRSELMELAKYGIEGKIRNACSYIADTWVNPDKIATLKKLITQYEEIVQEYDAARMEEAP